MDMDIDAGYEGCLCLQILNTKSIFLVSVLVFFIFPLFFQFFTNRIADLCERM